MPSFCKRYINNIYPLVLKLSHHKIIKNIFAKQNGPDSWDMYFYPTKTRFHMLGYCLHTEECWAACVFSKRQANIYQAVPWRVSSPDGGPSSSTPKWPCTSQVSTKQPFTFWMQIEECRFFTSCNFWCEVDFQLLHPKLRHQFRWGRRGLKRRRGELMKAKHCNFRLGNVLHLYSCRFWI